MVPYKPKRVKADPKLRVYVNNLPYDAEWTKLKEHMKSGGYLVSRVLSPNQLINNFTHNFVASRL